MFLQADDDSRYIAGISGTTGLGKTGREVLGSLKDTKTCVEQPLAEGSSTLVRMVDTSSSIALLMHVLVASAATLR